MKKIVKKVPATEVISEKSKIKKVKATEGIAEKSKIKKVKIQKSRPSLDTSVSSKIVKIKKVSKNSSNEKKIKQVAAKMIKPTASPKSKTKLTTKTLKKAIKKSEVVTDSDSKFSVKRMKSTKTSKPKTIAKKSKTFEAGDLLSVEVGAEQEENFRKFVLPQKHKLLKKLQQADQACVMIKNLPFGMVEKNLKKYVQQFGTVLRCRMPVNPRNGKSHSFAYVHYEHADVARVACATLNNYLMLGSLLKCTLVPGRYIKEKWFVENDSTYHFRINESVKRMNTVKSSFKEKRLLKKRNLAAVEALKTSNSKLTPKDLGIAE